MEASVTQQICGKVMDQTKVSLIPKSLFFLPLNNTSQVDHAENQAFWTLGLPFIMWLISELCMYHFFKKKKKVFIHTQKIQKR